MATGLAGRIRALARGLALAALAYAFLTGSLATAGVTLKEYRAILKDNKKKPLTRFQLLAQHIGGVYEGFEWANAYLRSRVKPQVYCRPKKRKVGIKALIGFLEAELRKPSIGKGKRYKPNVPIEAVLLTALRARWPCFS
ncbi:MAG: hypothetical protein O7I42_19255 [Alphaproteobacteria bacterium]|nr:hypothetical protein [Alphaproteobacteria bacterium]